MSEGGQYKLGLPTRVGNPAEDEYRGELIKRLSELNTPALGLGRSIAGQTTDVNKLWDKLLPILHEVRELLSKHCSQRKERRAAGLPTWQEWRAGFLKKSGLSACERTAQRHLKAFENLMRSPSAKPGSKTGTIMSSAERYQILSALQAANDLDEALSDDEDPNEALARFRANKIDPDRLLDILHHCKKPRQAEKLALGQASPGILFPPRTDAFRKLPVASVNECGIEFHVDNLPLLAEYLYVEHQDQFKNVFAALPPVKLQEVAQNFAQAMAKTILGFVGKASDPNPSAEQFDDGDNPCKGGRDLRAK